MINGIKKITRVPKTSFHHVYGGVSPTVIPDFCVDTGVNGFPEQISEGRPYECTGETITDILSDVYGLKLSPDFSYAAGLDIEGIDGTDPLGADILASMEGAIAHGVLALALAPLTALANTELYCSNFNNWPPQSKALALKRTQNGLMNALGNGDAFDSILKALYVGKIGISIGSPWFPNWTFPQPNLEGIQGAIVPMPSPIYSNWHNYAVKGKKTFNGVDYLMVKSWQGGKIGDNGWLYFSREVMNATLSIPGTGAFVFNPAAVRWVALLGIIMQRFPQSIPLLAKLF